ncbi:MAG: 3-phosphoshikimate 1-carboxyvinyltransferase, partial [Ferruginibacter sp.]|nr:3-phosphoshikimate 1-carboxyvinyltransferase [Ferruginibacter sp.]
VKERVSITVDNLKSKPYIDLSLKLLRHFGYDVSHDRYKIFYVAPAVTTEKNITYYTEADWSSASFLLVAAAIRGIVQVKGLDIHSVQADKSILYVLQQCNADIDIAADVISVTNKNQLHPFEFDATDCPDLFPPLVALAAHCSGTSVITGISRLAAKESNRAETLVNVFSKMGILIVLKDDAMFITGGTGIFPATVSSHHDHRIAMAAAIAGLNASGNMVIQDAEAVSKSYPDFYKHLVMLGAQVSLSN